MSKARFQLLHVLFAVFINNLPKNVNQHCLLNADDFHLISNDNDYEKEQIGID